MTMDRRIVNFLTAQFTKEDLSAALNTLLNPRTKRASTRSAPKARKVSRKRGRKTPAAPVE
jgi:hypothetical protein